MTVDLGDLLLQEIAVCRKLAPTKARIERSDWRTAGIVDKAIDMLAIGTPHDEVNAFLRDRMVPVEVIRRVLAGFGVRRHHEKRGV